LRAIRCRGHRFALKGDEETDPRRRLRGVFVKTRFRSASLLKRCGVLLGRSWRVSICLRVFGRRRYPTSERLLKRAVGEYFDVMTDLQRGRGACGNGKFFLRARECDIILLDVHDARHDGFEVCALDIPNPAKHSFPLSSSRARQPGRRVRWAGSRRRRVLTKPVPIYVLSAAGVRSLTGEMMTDECGCAHHLA